MEYFFSSAIGYLLGSIPTAYLVTKAAKGVDIRDTGSGNVGAMNTYEVSNSKFLGIVVFAVDALKGLLSVYLTLLLFPVDFIYPALAIFFAVFAHCFTPWLSFKGGRGLATGAGGMALLFPFLLIIWAILWLIVFVAKRDILFANIWATIMSLVITFFSSQTAFNYAYPKPDSISTLMAFSSAILIVIFIKHIDPLREILKRNKFSAKR